MSISENFSYGSALELELEFLASVKGISTLGTVIFGKIWAAKAAASVSVLLPFEPDLLESVALFPAG